MTMTIQIKCANCPTTTQRVVGGTDEEMATWLCPDCDPDDGSVAVRDEDFGSSGDDKPAKRVPDRPGGWFADDGLTSKPTRAQRKQAEQRLAKYGLARHQLRSQQDVQPVVKPILEGSEFHGGIQDYQFDRRLDRKSWHSDARRRANGSELNGHHAVQTREHERLIPAWALNDEQVRKVLCNLFPKHDKDAKQRESAGRWLRIVYLYFRANQWAKDVATAVGCSVRAVENVIYRARKAGAEMFESASSAVDTFEDTGKKASNEVVIQPIGTKADQAHHAPMDN